MTVLGTAGDDILIGTPEADNIQSGAGDDGLYGLGGDDTLAGGSGNDILAGGQGADHLDGGDGRDVAVYLSSAAGVTVDLGSSSAQIGGDAEGDVLVSIEHITGSVHDDRLTGDDGTNVLRGAGGADYIDGGAGQDRASYAYSSVGVDIDLARTGPQVGGDAEGDVLVSVENITGSDHDDRIVGDAGKNEIAGGAGADYIDGGGGNDLSDYRGSDQAVDIDLTRAIQHGGFAEGDQLVAIENVFGSNYGDHIVGNASDNWLMGGNGNDTIDGVGGIDRINAGAGDDTVHGRSGTIAIGDSGNDTLVLHLEDRSPYYGYEVGLVGGTVVSDYLGTPLITVSENISGIGFERIEVEGSYASDWITGTSGADIVHAAGGDDWITGTSGGDSLDGGDGTDIVFLNYGATTASISIDLIAGTASTYASVTGFERLDAVTGLGNDTITGSSGYSTIHSGAGDDAIDVSAGNGSAIYTGTGFDELLGGAGRDEVFVDGTGNFDGGGGLDRLSLQIDELGGIFVNVDDGTTGTGITFHNFEWYDIIRSDNSLGNDTIQFANGDDYAYGGGGDDVILGYGGRDSLWGAAGNDSINAGDGNDELGGGAGDDVLTGGMGADGFVFSRGADIITDFNPGQRDTLTFAWAIAGQITNYARLLDHAVDVNGGVMIENGNGDTLFLDQLTIADLTSNAFRFS